MSRPGLSIMIKSLFGNYKEDAIQQYIGRKIVRIELNDTVDPDGALFLIFDDGEAIKIYDDGRSCCEARYMHTDDDLSQFVGATLTGAGIREGPFTEGEWGDMHEIQFLVVSTSLGDFTLETHNEHNGYYGGFWMTLEEVGAQCAD